MIIGGQALLLYAEPRLTRDIDITLGVDLDRFADVLELAQELELTPLPDDPAGFAERTMVLPVEQESSGLRVDLIFSMTDYERSAIKHSALVRLGDADVHFASPEDLVIHKLFAGRPRDLEDVKSVIRRNPTLDLDYIRGWLREFDASVPGKRLLKDLEDML